MTYSDVSPNDVFRLRSRVDDYICKCFVTLRDLESFRVLVAGKETFELAQGVIRVLLDEEVPLVNGIESNKD